MEDSGELRSRRWSNSQNRCAWLASIATVGWLGYILLTSRLLP